MLAACTASAVRPLQRTLAYAYATARELLAAHDVTSQHAAVYALHRNAVRTLVGRRYVHPRPGAVSGTSPNPPPGRGPNVLPAATTLRHGTSPDVRVCPCRSCGCWVVGRVRVVRTLRPHRAVHLVTTDPRARAVATALALPRAALVALDALPTLVERPTTAPTLAGTAAFTTATVRRTAPSVALALDANTSPLAALAALAGHAARFATVPHQPTVQAGGCAPEAAYSSLCIMR